MNTPQKFLIIDDDPINNMICSAVVKKDFPEIPINTFEKPEEGLEYINQEYELTETKLPTILLLDINMPVISGWQFLERFKNFNASVKECITIYILSSSISDKDIEQAETNPLVKGYLQKPFTSQTLHLIIDAKN